MEGLVLTNGNIYTERQKNSLEALIEIVYPVQQIKGKRYEVLTRSAQMAGKWNQAVEPTHMSIINYHSYVGLFLQLN